MVRGSSIRPLYNTVWGIVLYADETSLWALCVHTWQELNRTMEAEMARLEEIRTAL